MKIKHTIALVALGLLAACGEPNDSGLFEVRARASSSGSDAEPSPSYVAASAQSHLWLTIREVRVHVSDVGLVEPSSGNLPPTNESDDLETSESSDSGWYTVFSGEQRLDLFDPNETSVFVGELRVPEGKAGAIRLLLSDDTIYQTPTGSFPVRCPSCSQSGLKLPISGGVIVRAGERLRATLVFAGDHSLRQKPEGYVLSPVIHVEVTRLP